MSLYEEQLKQRIEDEYQAFLASVTPEGKQAHFQQMRALAYQAQAERLHRLERDARSSNAR